MTMKKLRFPLLLTATLLWICTASTVQAEVCTSKRSVKKAARKRSAKKAKLAAKRKAAKSAVVRCKGRRLKWSKKPWRFNCKRKRKVVRCVARRNFRCCGKAKPGKKGRRPKRGKRKGPKSRRGCSRKKAAVGRAKQKGKTRAKKAARAKAQKKAKALCGKQRRRFVGRWNYRCRKAGALFSCTARRNVRCCKKKK